jgi:hypothetical protein
MTLLRGRKLEGRVLRNGEPVEDFEITHWPYDWSDQSVVAFRERTDGSFTLDAVSTGPVFLNASAQGASPSATVAVEPGESSPPPVTLELGDLVRGKGQVVDGATGEPLAQAKIQPFTSENGIPIAPWGPPLSVGSDGSFDCSGFSAGRELVRFSAPGYSAHLAETFGQAGETIDFGRVSLHERQDLVVQLVADFEVDFTRFTCGGDGVEPLPEQPFDGAGRAVITGVSAGKYAFVVVGEGGVHYRESLVLLPGEDWQCTIPVAGARRVRVSVDPRAELPGDAYFAITLPNPERGGIRVTVPVPPERAVEVSSPHSGEVRAELVAPTATSRPRVGGRILESDELLELVIDLEAVGQRFRIVDPAGQPVPRVAIRMILRDGPPPGWDGFADEVGELTMEPFVPGSYLAYMEHPELGYHFGVPVEVPQLTPEPVDIRFLPNQVVELRLLDGAEPLPSVSCLLIEEHGFARLPVASSDGSGRVRWEGVGEGGFIAQVRQGGYWPTDASVQALPPGQSTEVQVRRLGDLDLSVQRLSGASAAGLVLELEALELGTSVAAWIEEGLVSSSTGSLATDGEGRLGLTGLPRGSYRWTAEGQSGVVDVLAGRRAELVVSLP